jgi:hypothetical protein
MQGFLPDPAVDPSGHRIRAERRRLWHINEERRAIAVEGRARSAAHCLTTIEWGLDGEDPARRCLADRWHHRGTHPSAPTGSTVQACSHGNRTGAPGCSYRDASTAGRPRFHWQRRTSARAVARLALPGLDRAQSPSATTAPNAHDHALQPPTHHPRLRPCRRRAAAVR